MVDGQTETRTPSSKESCAAFLHVLEHGADTLGAKRASREYRASFTANYKYLFPNNCRNYRFDVLEASIEQQRSLHVNGDKFDISAQTLGKAMLLQAAWKSLGEVLTPSLLTLSK